MTLILTRAEQGVALLMPSLLQTMTQTAFDLKIVTVMPGNPQRGLSRIKELWLGVEVEV
jgi:ornithine cyclodeaminase/alanine dehydrogenase-like protein (mu-crystallin family)